MRPSFSQMAIFVLAFGAATGLAQSSNSATAYFNRANDCRAKGHLVGALADYSRAIELDPQMAEAYGHRGLVLLRQGQMAEAEKDFAQCLKLDATLNAALDERIKEIRKRRAGKP